MEEAADKESKTEEPTEKKIRDAVDRGQIPVSREISMLFGILAFTAYFVFFGQDTVLSVSGSLSSLMDRSDSIHVGTGEDVAHVFQTIILQVGAALVPLFAILIVAAFTASFLQNQPAMVADRITPKASRISPKAGFQRIFGSAGIVEFLKSVAKFLSVALVVGWSMKSVPSILLDGMFQQTPVFGNAVWSVALQLMITVAAAMTIIAGADLVWSRVHWRTGLRMTRQELKDEMKQAEGDPIVKARLRSIARDRARSRMMNSVSTATLVVANPTHFAVAMRYDRSTDAAPVVVAKGQDLIALKIRELAEAHDVAVFEDVELARSLYKAVRVDQLIPPVFFAAVAELIRIVESKPSTQRL